MCPPSPAPRSDRPTADDAQRFPFLGTSACVTGFLRDLETVAGSEASVLFQGPTGSGKSSGARHLHALGTRSAGPLVPVHLAALSPTLIEASLFGHERGAFTDAHRERRGIFQRASGGTVVLDDIDLLAPELQVKLLRVLQERVVEPLGSERPVEVDVRVLSTTNKDLRAEVEAGRFREDLYYRLAVVVLVVPPLRSRPEDLAPLTDALIARVARRSGVEPRPLSPKALERLRAHPWPGNVRELENALERVLVLGRDHGAAADPVAEEELGFLDEARAGAAEELAELALARGLGVEELSLALLARALEEHRGNVSAAARAVGLTRRAFEYRLGRRADQESASEGDKASGGAA